MSDLIEQLRAYDPTAKLVDRLREHDLAAYPEDGDWQDHYCDRADDLLKEAADRIAALEAEASEGERRGLELRRLAVVGKAFEDALRELPVGRRVGLSWLAIWMKARSDQTATTVAEELSSEAQLSRAALIPEAPAQPELASAAANQISTPEVGLPEAPAEGWQPISSAPKDGTVVWVWCPAYEDLGSLTSLASWHEDAGWCVDELRAPTMWRPLQAPPPPSQDWEG